MQQSTRISLWLSGVGIALALFAALIFSLAPFSYGRFADNLRLVGMAFLLVASCVFLFPSLARRYHQRIAGQLATPGGTSHLEPARTSTDPNAEPIDWESNPPSCKNYLRTLLYFCIAPQSFYASLDACHRITPAITFLFFSVVLLPLFLSILFIALLYGLSVFFLRGSLLHIPFRFGGTNTGIYFAILSISAIRDVANALVMAAAAKIACLVLPTKTVRFSMIFRIVAYAIGVLSIAGLIITCLGTGLGILFQLLPSTQVRSFDAIAGTSHFTHIFVVLWFGIGLAECYRISRGWALLIALFAGFVMLGFNLFVIDQIQAVVFGYFSYKN